MQKELKALKPEELHEIFIECVREFFKKDDFKVLKELLTTQDRFNYGRVMLSKFSESMIESCDFTALQEVVDKAIECLKNDHRYLMEGVLTNLFVKGVCGTPYFDESVRNVITNWQSERYNG